MDKEVFIQHRRFLKEQLPDSSITLVYAGQKKQKSYDMDYPFCINRNFYYMTGLSSPNCVLMITKLLGEVKETIFIDRPDPHMEKNFGKMQDKEDVAQQSGIEAVEYVDRLDWHIGRLLFRSHFEHLLFDFHKRDLDNVRYPENDMCERIASAHPHLYVSSVSMSINNLRRIKCDQEVACIQKAIDVTATGIAAIMDHLRDGVGEATLAAYFDFALAMNGVKETAFDSIIAGGSNSNVLHYSRNNQTLHAGDVLLVDLGAEFDYYAADISRTLPVSGRFTSVQRTVYDAVLDGQEKIIEYLSPGKPIDETLTVARKVIGNKLMKAGLISSIEEMQHVLPHGVCHYLGLDCHDVGEHDLLMPGMIVAVEPGAYFPGLGFGIRIEDVFLITENGVKCLSAQIPKSVDEIEACLGKYQSRATDGPVPLAD